MEDLITTLNNKTYLYPATLITIDMTEDPAYYVEDIVVSVYYSKRGGLLDWKYYRESYGIPEFTHNGKEVISRKQLYELLTIALFDINVELQTMVFELASVQHNQIASIVKDYENTAEVIDYSIIEKKIFDGYKSKRTEEGVLDSLLYIL